MTGKRKAESDLEILRKNFEFIRDEEKDRNINRLEPSDEDYGRMLGKKYYDKLYKEFVIVDLSKYETGKIGMRWRIEKEVVTGKGETICASKKCTTNTGLSTFEVNFKYVEKGEEKNALVKVKLCSPCAYKLNHQKKHKKLE